MNNRLAIYLVYDNQNIIDRYIEYILNALREVSSHVTVVVQGKYIKKGEEYLKSADEIFFRQNIGFDAGGFKDALCNLIGWEKVDKYEELILVNDSFFGPFTSMKKIFDDMNNFDYDFWGITEHALSQNAEKIIPRHIQSFFYAFRYRILHSNDFKRYWINLPVFTNFNDVIEKHEILFTKYFYDLGYKYGCIANMNPNDSKSNYKNNYSQYKYLQYELISKRNCPILKKKTLTIDTLELQTQESCQLALNYIKNETTYDVDMIWENLIRTMDISDIQKKFHLDYIVKANDRKEHMQNVKIVVMASHLNATEYVFEKLDWIVDKTIIVVIAADDSIKKMYERQGYSSYLLKGKELYQLFLSFKLEQYLICLLCDFDMTSDVEPSCIGKSIFYNIWNNLLLDKQHVESIINLFGEDKRLGLLAPPKPNFAHYFGKAEYEWDCFYPEIENMIEVNMLSCKISKHKMPLTISNSVWVRGYIFYDIIKCELLNNKILPFIWSYFAQNKGCYAGIVSSENYASINEINQQYYLTQIINLVQKQYGHVNTFEDLQKLICKGRILQFCNTYEKIYVYGTGGKAKLYMDMIPKIEGFIVSDGRTKEDTIKGVKIFYLSEISTDNDTGIVVCLNEENQELVIPLLKNREMNYLCI